MADDLSTLDETRPLASDPVSQGDDAIRDTRRHVKNWAGVEHALTGEHTLPYGDSGDRPSAGHEGRVFLNVVQERMEVDNGAVWGALHAVAKALQIATGSVTLSTADYVTVATVTPNVLSGQNALLYGSCFLSWSTNVATETSGVMSRFLVNGIETSHPARRHWSHFRFGSAPDQLVNGDILSMILATGLPAGSIPVEFQVKVNLNGTQTQPITASYRHMGVLLF